MRESAPSQTALKVARTLVYLGGDPAVASMLPSGAADATARLLGAMKLYPSWMQALVALPAFRALSDVLTEFVGGRLHFGLRKRFVDDEVRGALACGAEQVLVVGAGYDTLCLRLAAEYPERLFVEVDHPATHRAKRVGVDRIGAARGNLRLLGIDLAANPLPDALARAGWDSGARSVVVAEGILMYLDEAAVVDFLTAVHRTTGPGSLLVFTWMRGGAGGRPDMGVYGRVLATAVALLGEPFRWAVPDHETLADVLAARGFAYVPDPQRCDLVRRYLAPAGLPDGGESALPELMAVASRRAATAERSRDAFRSA